MRWTCTTSSKLLSGFGIKLDKYVFITSVYKNHFNSAAPSLSFSNQLKCPVLLTSAYTKELSSRCTWPGYWWSSWSSRGTTWLTMLCTVLLSSSAWWGWGRVMFWLYLDWHWRTPEYENPLSFHFILSTHLTQYFNPHENYKPHSHSSPLCQTSHLLPPLPQHTGEHVHHDSVENSSSC